MATCCGELSGIGPSHLHAIASVPKNHPINADSQTKITAQTVHTIRDLETSRPATGINETIATMMSISILHRTSSCGTGEMEARIQRGMLSPVATSVLFGFLFGFTVLGRSYKVARMNVQRIGRGEPRVWC